MSTDQLYIGVGLTIALAVACQIAGFRLRIPSLILLLPVGFAAGALTGDVNPDNLLGPVFPVLVSVSVAVILYDSGLGLNLGKLTGHTRTVVVRLLAIGVPLTGIVTALVAKPLFGLSQSAAIALRYRMGARVRTARSDGSLPAGHDLLFRVRASGMLMPVVGGVLPEAHDGDVDVMLGPAVRRDGALVGASG